jgi:hypothetical protein
MQELFRCTRCGVDTLTQQHKSQCNMAVQEARRQTEMKCQELGITYNLDAYQLPLRLGET